MQIDNIRGVDMKSKFLLYCETDRSIMSLKNSKNISDKLTHIEIRISISAHIAYSFRIRC